MEIKSLSNCLLTPYQAGCKDRSGSSKGCLKGVYEKIKKVFWSLIACIFFPCTLLGLSLSKRCAVVSKPRPKPRSKIKRKSINTVKSFKNWVQRLADFQLPSWFVIEVIKDSVHFKGKEKKQFVQQRIEQLREILCFRASPSEFMKGKMDKEFGTEQTVVALQILLPEFETLIHAYPKENKLSPIVFRHLSLIDHCKNRILEIINIKELHDLKKRLIEETGEDLAETFLKDWDLIGKDIQENRSVLTEVRKEQILAKAREVRERKKRLDVILEELRRDLERDLPPSEEVILKKYQELPKLLAVLPGSNLERLQRLISWAYIHQQIKKPASFLKPDQDYGMVQLLGYDAKKYDDKEKMQKMIVSLLQELLNQGNFKSVRDLKREIELFSRSARLQAAGVKKNEVADFCEIAKSYKEKINAERKKIPIENFCVFQRAQKLSLQRQESLLQKIKRQTYSVFNSSLNAEMRKFKNEIRSYLGTEECRINFEKLLNEKIFLEEKIEGLTKTINNYFHDCISWFEEYSAHIVSEFSQGEKDLQEVFLEGVCYALSIRLCKRVLEDPKSDIKVIAVNSIQPIDRLLQASYQVHKEFGKYLDIPDSILAKQKLQQRAVFIAKGEEESKLAAIMDQIGNLKRSFGTLNLCGEGHSTVIRFDEINDQYFLSDVNFGAVEFKKEAEESVEDVVRRLAVCYLKLYRWAYGNKGCLLAIQIVPYDAHEKFKPIDWDNAKIY